MTLKANIYHDGNTWYAALWVNGEFDGCHELDADCESDARQECVETFGDVVVKRVDDVIRFSADGRISLVWSQKKGEAIRCPTQHDLDTLPVGDDLTDEEIEQIDE